jgi:hypothetical protein
LKALEMSKKEVLSTGLSDALFNHGSHKNSAGISSSRPTPEDGRRLIHAFFDIKPVALREAIIQLVTELSKRHYDQQ